MRTVHIPAPSKSYDVLIGNGIIKNAGEYIAQKTASRTAAVITDDKVDGLYSHTVISSLEKEGFRVVKYVFPNGEAQKNLETVQNILEFLALHNITRTDFLVAVGGGVVGDITGFCAAIYLRGIRFFQFPTTFLAAIDSSVGGKTGVNLDAGKNLAGAFWQPEMVICDCNTFSTLPYDVFSDGTAEAIKYGVIADKDLFSMLSSGSLSENLIDVIECCVKIKSELVSCDEFDRGRRLLLNFGHTIAHAIEKCSNFSIPHGRAVGIGMALISKAAYQLGFSNVDCAKPISEALHKYSLPDASPFEKQALLHAIGYDKKRSGDEITLVLPVRIGECCYEKFSLKELPRFLDAAFSDGGF